MHIYIYIYIYACIDAVVFDLGVFFLFNRSIMFLRLCSINNGARSLGGQKTPILRVFRGVPPRTRYRSKRANIQRGFLLWRSLSVFRVHVGVRLAFFSAVQNARTAEKMGFRVSKLEMPTRTSKSGFRKKWPKNMSFAVPIAILCFWVGAS